MSIYILPCVILTCLPNILILLSSTGKRCADKGTSQLLVLSQVILFRENTSRSAIPGKTPTTARSSFQPQSYCIWPQANNSICLLFPALFPKFVLRHNVLHDGATPRDIPFRHCLRNGCSRLIGSTIHWAADWGCVRHSGLT